MADGPSLKATASDPSSGLVAAYGFDETSGSTTADASSFGNTGTLGSGVTRSTSGRFGGALSFNRGIVSIPDAPSLRLSRAMTLEAWVNPSTVTSAWRDAVYKADDNYYLMATSTNGSRPAGGASFGNTSATTEAYGTSAIAANTWTHLAVTYDGSTIRLYVNGAQVSSVSKTGSFTAASNPLQIGGNSLYQQYFTGKIDEVRVYNRALAVAEIQSDMNTAVGAVTAPPPVDGTAPTVSVTSPSTTGSYSTTSSQVAVSGTASDNVGVTTVQWSNDRGGSGVATGTTSWSIPSIALQPGANVITVGAQDAAGNVGSTTLTVSSNIPTPATQLTITTQPATSATNGAAFSRQPVIQLRNAAGATVSQSGVAVTATIASGGGTLGGTTTVTTNASGVATFTNLSITGLVGSRTLRFSSGSLTAATSSAVAITAGAASQLVFSTIGSQTTNTAFDVTVTLADASTNPVANSGGTATVTLTRQTGTGTLGGKTSGTIPIGSTSVTISGVTYSAGETGVSLLATGSGFRSTASGKKGTSNSFTVVAQTPPPPPGDTGTTAPSYSTNFPLTEFPISEGGRWLNGGTDGIDWTDVSTSGGRAIGHQVGASYTDATALLKGSWPKDQTVSATVFNSSAVSDGCYAEVELRLRSSIAAHDNHGYEISYKVSSTNQAYLIIVRWNGAYSNFSYLLTKNGAQYGVKDGDVVTGSIVGNVITAYKNGVMMAQVTDGTYTSGSPGIGFNLEASQSGCSGINDRYGFTQFSVTDAGSSAAAIRSKR